MRVKPVYRVHSGTAKFLILLKRFLESPGTHDSAPGII